MTFDLCLSSTGSDEDACTALMQLGTVALEQGHRLDHIIPSKNNNNYKGADCVTVEMLKVVTATSTYCMSSRFPACTFISRNLF